VGKSFIPGADPGFQVRRAHLKKLRRAEGDAKIFGVFRVKNQSRFYAKKSYFPILGEAHAGCAPPPPLEPPLYSMPLVKPLTGYGIRDYCLS
jgi:hypothetical protein